MSLRISTTPVARARFEEAEGQVLPFAPEVYSKPKSEDLNIPVFRWPPQPGGKGARLN